MKESISRSLGHDRSSLLSSKGFSAAAETAACTDLHRQHICGFVYKSSRRVEIAPRVGSDDLEPLALRESGGGSVRQEREHALPVVLHSPLTSRWPAARPYAFPPIKKVAAGVMRDQGGASIRDTHRPEPAWVPRLTELLEAPPCRSPAGIICYPRWRARCGTRTWNYGAIMCDRFRGIREDGRLTVSHAHGSAKTLYKTFVCFKWECLWKSQAHIDPTTCTVCSEFPAAQTG